MPAGAESIDGRGAGEPPRPARRALRYKHSRRRRRRWPRRLGYVVALLSVAAGLGIGAHVYLFYRHSDRVGSALVHREERAVASADASGRCTSSFPGTATTGTGASVAPSGGSLAAGGGSTSGGGAPKVYALLKAPAIGLVAPVVEGTDDPQLDVAVGHVPASSWPGASGTAVLAAHDVTWFSHIDQLAPGAVLSIVTPCQTYVYTVADHQVVAAGTPIYQSSTSRLVLVTCYPLDALFLTSQRFVLEATLTRVVHAGSATTAPATAPVPDVPAPAPLVAEGLDLADNPTPLGTLAVGGTPAASWQQSSAPLDDEAAVLELYFAALRSAGQDEPAWWAVIAPGVPFSAASPVVGATITGNDLTVSPSLTVDGSSLTGASLAAEPVLQGSDAPGAYRIAMTATVRNGQLVLTGWTMTRAG